MKPQEKKAIEVKHTRVASMPINFKRLKTKIHGGANSKNFLTDTRYFDRFFIKLFLCVCISHYFMQIL